MDIDKSAMRQDGDVFYAPLPVPGNMWIGVSLNGKEPKITDQLLGKSLIVYPEEHWVDPPLAVMDKLRIAIFAAEKVYEISQKKAEIKKKPRKSRAVSQAQQQKSAP